MDHSWVFIQYLSNPGVRIHILFLRLIHSAQLIFGVGVLIAFLRSMPLPVDLSMVGSPFIHPVETTGSKDHNVASVHLSEKDEH